MGGALALAVVVGVTVTTGIDGDAADEAPEIADAPEEGSEDDAAAEEPDDGGGEHDPAVGGDSSEEPTDHEPPGDAGDEPVTGVDLASASVHPGADDEAPVIGISPDGSTVLSLHGDDRDEVCLRELEQPEPRGCVDVGMTPRQGWAGRWSDDGSVFALGDESVEEAAPPGEVVLIDAEAATATFPLEESRPDDLEDGDPYVGYVNPSPSPDGSALVVERWTETARHAVHLDLSTGEERELADIERGSTTSVWSPDGSTVWVSYADDDYLLWVLRVDVATGETSTLNPTVEIGSHGRNRGWLVQVSENERTGLLLLASNAMLEIGDENRAILAVIDLESGRTAPALPDEARTDPDVGYAGLRGGRLSADGSILTLIHQDVPGYEHADADLQVVQLPVGSILDRTYDREVLVGGLGEHLDLERPLSVTTTTWYLFDPVLPADGSVLTVPVGIGRQQSPDEDFYFQQVDHYVRLPASFEW